MGAQRVSFNRGSKKLVVWNVAPGAWYHLCIIVQDEKAAAAAAAMDVDEETPSNHAAGQPKAGEEKAAGKLHVLGIGGRRAKRGSSKATGTKKTPGEIRIQKGECCAAAVALWQCWCCSVSCRLISSFC